MTKGKFIKILELEEPTKEQKLEACQYFIDNYPVQIDQIIPTPLGVLRTGNKIWTSLHGFNLKQLKKFDLEDSWSKLVGRIEEIKTFKDE